MGCRASVEAELRDVPGVRQVDVNLKTQSATVVFDPARADVDVLMAAISRAGANPNLQDRFEPRDAS